MRCAHRAARSVLVLVSVVSVTLAACDGDEQPRTSPPTAATASLETWQYVAIGDSTHRDVAAMFAAIIEAELGVEVEPRAWINPDLATYEVGGERASDLVARLRTDQELRSDLREAEVITFVVPYGSFIDICPFDPDLYMPVGTEAELRDCWPTFLEGFRGDVTAFFDELVAIRSPSEAAIRVVDHYQSMWEQPHDLGVYEVARRHWQEMNAAIHAAADEHGIPVVHAYDAINGRLGRTDGVAAGYLGEDQLHLTIQGAELLAGLLADLGYEPASG